MALTLDAWHRPLSRGTDYALSTTTDAYVLARRHLPDGTVAGITVGVVIFVLLLALCLYPFIVAYLKRRIKQQRLHRQRLDVETAIAEITPQGLLSRLHLAPELSASHTLGPDAAPLARGHHHDGRASSSVDVVCLNYVQREPEPSQATIEYMPHDTIDMCPGVLMGTSEDYYRPSIPSSAFGMLDQTSTVESFARTISKAGALSHNVRHIISRKSNRKGKTHLDKSPSPENQSQSSSLPTSKALPTEETVKSRASTMLSKGQKSWPEGVSNDQKSIFKRTSVFATEYPALTSPREETVSVSPIDLVLSSVWLENLHRDEVNPVKESSSPSQQPHPEPQPEPSTATQNLELPSSAGLKGPDAPFAWISPPDFNAQTSFMDCNTQPFDFNSLRDVNAQPGFMGINSPKQQNPELNETSPEKFLSAHNAENTTQAPGLTPNDSSPSEGLESLNVSPHSPSTQLNTSSSPSGNSMVWSNSTSSQEVAVKDGSSTPTENYHLCLRDGCNSTFPRQFKLNHHQRYHDKPYACDFPDCEYRFGTITHLKRHVNDRHEKKKVFYCTAAGCAYSFPNGKYFSRKDNWKRHVLNKHDADRNNLPPYTELNLE